MSAVGKHLTHGLDVRFGNQIQSVQRHAQRYLLTNSAGEDCGVYDRVILAIPAPQAAQLIDPKETLHDLLKSVRYESVWALLAAFDESLPVSWQTLTCRNATISWVSREFSKPGRSTKNGEHRQQSAGDRLVVHSSPEWASERLDENRDAVLATMMSELETLLSVKLPKPIVAQVHRWRYARPVGEVSGTSHLRSGIRSDCWPAETGIALLGSASSSQHT